MKVFLEGCSGKQFQQLQQLSESEKEVFKEPHMLPSKWEVEHDIQLLMESSLPNIGLYRKSLIESDDVKKKPQQLLD